MLRGFFVVGCGARWRVDEWPKVGFADSSPLLAARSSAETLIRERSTDVARTPRRASPPPASAAKTLAAIRASGQAPLDYMLQVMRDETQELAKRLDAAKAAAPYVHPRLASVAVGNQDDKPFEQVIRWALSEEEAAPDPAGKS